MQQLDTLDFENSSKIINHPLPTQNGDGVNKEYVYRKSALYKANYTPSVLSTVTTTTTSFSDIPGLTLQSSSAPYSLLYLIELKVRITGNQNGALEIYYDVNTVIGGISFAQTVGGQQNDYSFWSLIPPNKTVKVKWRLTAAISSLTYTFDPIALTPYFSLTGFHGNLFTLP